MVPAEVAGAADAVGASGTAAPPRPPAEEVQIRNVVASATLGRKLDLPWLESRLLGADFRRNKFPGLIYRLDRPKGAFLVFATGKVVGTGFRSLEEMNAGARRLVADLRALEVGVEEPEFAVQNVIAVGDLKAQVRLDTLAVHLGLENVEYEPECFPGLVYRLRELGMVLLLFGTGKVILAGGRSARDCQRAMEALRLRLESAGAL